ncbi:hypothetical protein JOM56_012457 [Amanita muscaria]
MLVDNSLPSHLAADFSDFINTDLFSFPNSLASSSPPSDNDSSPPQSPFHSLLTTPPQDLPPAAFPDFDPSSSASTSAVGSGLSFFDDDPLKSIDPMSFDFMSLPGMESISLNYPGNMHIPMSMDLSMGLNMDTGIPVDDPSTSDLASYLGIDPSLVGTSVSTSELETIEEESSDEAPEPNSQQTPKQGQKQDDQRERLTLTITPAKVGGYGKARKGTVQSGGIVKKSGHPPGSHSRDKENSGLLSKTSSQTAAAISANAAALKRAKTRATSEAASSVDDAPSPGPSATGSTSPLLFNQDDLSIDWRPAPEVLAKMSSKEKRQLRNKISARNFRVRRKEYITTLEGDIADRDRLLDAVRTELGSTQSENLALRQEIAALKKILLEGGGGELASLNLPPPAPLALSKSGSMSASGAGSGSIASVSGFSSLGETPTPAAATASSSSCVIDPALTPHSSATSANVSLALPTPTASPLRTPNTQKDLPTSPRLGAAAFWGGTTRSSFGMGMGGGITPVHTVLVPDLSMSFGAGVGEDVSQGEGSVTRALQENMNPALNGSVTSKNVNVSSNLGSASNVGGFEGWADFNPLTMKTLDAYRMHLWGKMAAQQQFQRNLQAQTHRSTGPALTGLASGLRPHFFTSPSTSSSLYPTPPSTPPMSLSHGLPMGSTLSALLSGKHSASSSYSNHSGLSTPPGSPSLRGSDKDADRFKEKEREQREHAALAAIAGQTLFKKLGSAFWDAFSGNSSTTTLSNKSSKDLDVDKVRKVLEGKAVVRVVDVEPSSSSGSMSTLTASLSTMSMDEKKANEKKCPCTNILEESMKSLTVSKKV